jgi:hypothetical protein
MSGREPDFIRAIDNFIANNDAFGNFENAGLLKRFQLHRDFSFTVKDIHIQEASEQIDVFCKRNELVSNRTCGLGR